jgi:predicted RNA-binding Zn-ribbon protein involved in translation (DUF1610 family)
MVKRLSGNVQTGGGSTVLEDDAEHFQCPYCASFEVDRLFLASMHMDSCACLTCGARWDEDATSGEFRGRSSRSSVMTPRDA